MVFESLFQNTVTKTSSTSTNTNTNKASTGKNTNSNSNSNDTATTFQEATVAPKKNKKRKRSKRSNALKPTRHHHELPPPSSHEPTPTTPTIPTIPITPITPRASFEERRLFSDQLRRLSSQKRLSEVLSIYRSPSNASLRDEHQVGIVVDCCARCGRIDEGETIVRQWLREQHHQHQRVEEEESRNHHHNPRRNQRKRTRPYEPPIANVPTNTALLKGYAHAGMAAKACALYQTMMDARNPKHRPNVRSLNTFLRGCLWTAAGLSRSLPVDNRGGRSGENEPSVWVVVGGVVSSERVWPRTNPNTNPNTHTHTPTRTNILPDLSSYEYSICLLSQSLHTTQAIDRIQHLQSSIDHTTTDNHLETLVVAYVSIARAFCLLGRYRDALRYARDAVHAVENGAVPSSETHGKSFSGGSGDGGGTDRSGGRGDTKGRGGGEGRGRGRGGRVMGGKRGFGTGTGTGAGAAAGESRREASDTLFRAHKLSTLRTDADGIVRYASAALASYNNDNNNNSNDDSDDTQKRHKGKPKRTKQQHETNTVREKESVQCLAFCLITRLLYFSGGGTTTLTESSNQHGEAQDGTITTTTRSNVGRDRQRLINSLWYSFGLSRAIELVRPDTYSSLPQTGVLSRSDCRRVVEAAMGERRSGDDDSGGGNGGNDRFYGVLDDDGYIDFSEVFPPHSWLRNGTSHDAIGVDDGGGVGNNGGGDGPTPSLHDKTKTTPLTIELGSGFGEWIVHRARSDPSTNYVAVELRSDRTATAFSKAFLNVTTPAHQKDGGTSTTTSSSPLAPPRPIPNLCCVGAACEPFLRDRVRDNTVSAVVVHHPEPPTQTYGARDEDLDAIVNGSTEEPAHMLTSRTLFEIARCLVKDRNGDVGFGVDGGGGRLVIVTDNRWYANLICCTVVKLMKKHPGLLYGGRADGCLRRIDEFPHDEASRGRAAAGPRVALYEGQASEFVNRIASAPPERNGDNNNGKDCGSTYFDRLWRTGAGTHAETKRRFVVYLTTDCPTSGVSGGDDKGTSRFNDNDHDHDQRDALSYGKGRGEKSRRTRLNQQGVHGRNGDVALKGKKNKKKSAEKQKRRNERRLARKKAAETEGGNVSS